ncbi:MAG: hypothetical protein OHK0046_16470 [Anaerolineae bacterium]
MLVLNGRWEAPPRTVLHEVAAGDDLQIALAHLLDIREGLREVM